MATTYHNAIQQLYVAYFNRPADPAGLAFWEGVMEGNGGDSSVISAEFAKSAEYTTEYDQLTTSGVVTQVYQNLFGHAPDAAGLAFWVKALNDKAMTVDTMVTEIAKGAQGTDKVAFESKVVVATAFTTELDTDAEIAGFNSEDGLAAAKELIAGIKTAAQATAAIEPDALEAHVAAVVKAGTPFTLESGLAALGAAQADLAAFLKAEKATEAGIAADVTDAEDAIEDLVADPLYGTTTNAGVKAALLAAQIEQNADDLDDAQEVLTDALEVVEKVDGLGDAIAAATSAEEGVEAAIEALEDATTDATVAYNELDTRNADLTFDGSLADGDLVIKDGADTVAEFDNGVLVLGEDIDAADYAGLAAFITAGNEQVSAAADLESAEEAAMLAQLQVELLDLSDPLVAGTFTFTETTPANASKETFDEILDELSARTAAGTDGAFRTQIQNFINANTTAKADAVVAAEIGTLGLAKAAIADVDGLSAAMAAQEELTAAQAALDDANTAFGTERTDFLADAANSTLFVNADGTVGTTDGGNDVVALNGDGELEAADGVDETTNPGLTDLLAAGNAVIEAQADVTDAALTGAETTLLGNNGGLIADLEAAELAATSTDAEVRVEALGVEGAQDAVEALVDAQDDLEEAEAVAAELKSLKNAIETAVADFEANDYNEPDMLDSATAFGRTGSDIFVLGDEDTVSITNFGRSGDDVLYIGSGFSLNETGDIKKGDDAVMEVFFIQKGNNVEVTIETEKFGSNSAEAEIVITLTGVDADDLTFENGIISI